VADPLDVCRLQVHVADDDAGIDRPLATLAWFDASRRLGLCLHKSIERHLGPIYSAAGLGPARRTRMDDAAMLTTTAPISPALTSLVINPAPRARAPRT
jgi:hypothetical protein